MHPLRADGVLVTGHLLTVIRFQAIHHTLADGRPFRVLSVVDVFSRSSEILEPGTGFTGARVAELLEKAAKGQLPASITADNGTEFTSKALDAWAFERGVKLDFTTPGKPTENGFLESFQGRFRDECLNVDVFHDLTMPRRRSRFGDGNTTPKGRIPLLATSHRRSTSVVGIRRRQRRSEFRDPNCPIPGAGQQRLLSSKEWHSLRAIRSASGGTRP